MSTAPARRPPPLSPGAVRPAQHQDGCEDAVAQWSRNPLLCWLCDAVYEDPRLLSCYHAFCGRCIGPRILEGRIYCPLCCKVTLTKDGQLPPRDNLMVFLVESSCEERPICANCDNRSLAVFFCNTCGQALCGLCREETHRARMFSTHDIIHMSKRGREVNKKCALHGEPYIMFSATKHAMLCINCFRESSVDARLHCTDLETAYNVGCKKLERGVMINPIPGETLLDIDTAYSQARQKLDRAAMSIRELQNSVRDGVILFNALLEELRKNMDTEKNNINNLAETIQENVRRMQEGLLREVDTQYDSKDKQFRSQLSSLGSLLPIIQVHLLMCTTFSSSASKYEFLDLVFQLMERLAAIAHLSHPLRPGQSSQIRSNYRSEFYRGLEPLLSVTNKARGDSTLPSGSSGCSDKPQSSEGGLSRPPSSASVVGPQGVFGLPGGSRRSLSAAKLKIFESGGPFADHCKVHETRFRQDLSSKFSRLKEEAQELHRDVTLRRCMTRRGRVEEIVRECASLEDEVRCYGDEIEELRAVFDSAWDEQIQRVYTEQEVFQSQVNDIASLRDENKRLMIIAQQLEPYIRSITALMERISPKLQVPATQMLTSSQICMIDNTEPNNVVMQQILDQITSCNKQEGNRSEGRGVGDGSSRGGVMLSDDGGIIPTPPQPPASSPGLLPDGIPKPPDPPHMRRSMDAQNEDQHGYSPGQVCGRSEIAALGGHHLPHHILPPGPPDHQYVNQLLPGTELMIFRKRQHSEGESAVYRELPWVGQGRRGSEGSEVDKQRPVGTNENSQPSSRPSSKERQRKARGGVTMGQRERAERLLEQAVASFDASAIPERPKSACENTILYQHIYGFGSDAMRHKEGRKSDEGIEKSKSRSRESSGSRPRSAEREQNGPGVIALKALKSQTLGKPPKRSGEVSKIHALIHADGFGRRQDNVYAVATVPRRPQGKKENIYENVVTMGDTVISRGYATISGRPFFRKQSSLDALPSGGSKVYRGGSMGRGATAACAPERRESGIRKADSFEGHEEAVRTLVAQVQKNRILRRKEVK